MSHHRIEAEAKQVATKQKAPRNVLTDPSPDIAPDVLAGILPDGRVTGYEKGISHKGTFYAECEGMHLYPDESFLRVIMYGDEFHDKETRIPLKMLAAAGFARQAPDSRDAALEEAAQLCESMPLYAAPDAANPIRELKGPAQ
jgi:hypothetical protein